MMMNTKSTIASPDPALQFLFSTFGILTWLSTVKKLPQDSAMTLGIIEICREPVLSVILGFSGGITQIVMVQSNRMGIPFHPWISAVIILLGGLFVTAILPLMTCMPLYEFLSHLFVARGFLGSSIGTLASLPWLHMAGAWCLLLFGITGMYYGISLMYRAAGRRIPQGPTLVQLMGEVEQSPEQGSGNGRD